MDTVLQVIGEEPVPLRLLNPSVPDDLETICMKCLEKHPSRRYATAQALADDLGRWLGGEPILARPASRLERIAKWSRRNPAAAAWLAAIPMLMLLGQETGFMAGCLAAAITFPMVAGRRWPIYGSVLGALLGLALLNLKYRAPMINPGRNAGDLSPEGVEMRVAMTVAALAIFGWLGGVAWATFRDFLPRRSRPAILAFGFVAAGLLLLPSLQSNEVPVGLQALRISGLLGAVIGRSAIISASFLSAIVGLGIGLLEGDYLRKIAPAAGRAESEGSIMWGLIGVILGIISVEVAYIVCMALNAVEFLGLLARYPYPTFLLLKFYYLGLGSFLGLNVAAEVGRRVSAGAMRPSFAAAEAATAARPISSRG
jgi:hypothetical protein